MKRGIWIILLLAGTLIRAQQITRDDIRQFLIIQNGNIEYDSLNVQSEQLYSRFIQHIGFRFHDAVKGTLCSMLSGISMGANEASLIRGSYEHYRWMPKMFQYWYIDSRSGYSGIPDYNPLSWQFVFRELDMAADIMAYDRWLRFFSNKWYFALLAHWIIKNTSATITRDLFRYGKPFYSFSFSMLLPSGRTFSGK